MTAAAGIATAHTSALFPLDPWRAEPPPGLLRLMPLDFWRAQRMLPVATDGDALLVASSAAIPGPVEAEIRGATYREVRRVAAAQDETELLLAVALDGEAWENALARSIHALIREVGLASPAEAVLPALPGRDLDVELVASAFEISEDAAVEILALRARLPWIRLARYTRPAYLSAVIPPDVARDLRVVPVLAHHGLVVIATPRVPGLATRERIRDAVGTNVRIALCGPSHVGPALGQIYSSTEEVPAAPADDDVYERLMRGGAIDRSRQAPLDRIASLTSEPRLQAAVRLGYVAAAAVRTAQAQLAGLPALEDEPPAVERAAAEAVLAARWRSSRCVPVVRSGKALTLVADRKLGARETEVIRRLTGAPEVHVRFLPREEIDSLARDLPDLAPATYRAEDHLLGSGIVAPERAAAVRRRAAHDGVPLLTVLAERGVVEPEDLIEAAALAAGRPWLHVDRCSPDPAAVAALDEPTARAELAVPIALRGRSLVVGIMGPDADPARVELAARVAVDPVYAVSSDVEALFARWYARRADVGEAYVHFARSLIARGWLTRQQVDRALDDMTRGRALDAALTVRAMLRPDQVAIALAAHLGLAVAEVGPREKRIRAVDALGREREDRVTEDPIDHVLARSLPRDVALRAGAIAMADRGRSVEVVFVDPLDEVPRAAVAAALGRPVTPSVATRSEIEAAQRRVYERPSVGERLVQAAVITREQLDRALDLHDKTGVRMGAALVTLGYVTELELAATIAEQSDLPFIDLFTAKPDPEVARLVPPDVARERGVLPIMDDGATVMVAATDTFEPADLQRIPGLAGRHIQPVVVTEGALDRALNEIWRDEYMHIAAAQLMSRSPEDSARWVLSSAQKVFFIGVVVATLLGLAISPVVTFTVYITLSTLFYVTFSAYKFYLAYVAMGTTLEIEVTPEDLALLDERELPVYTILVPVYKEARVFPILAKAIARLDYPKPKLDVKVLLEEDDSDTIEVARRAKLPAYVDLVIVPRGEPRGKPKACNYGLIHAKGEYVVIYDAEDIPEPDQLKKAIIAFRKGDPKLACIQAKLNYFNRDQNLLTRWFTTEYSMWFDLFLPGLDASHAPIPLGGTSNHFKTARLRELGAWDPHNVTEDADLGMRLYKRGWSTAVIDSTTFEEANCELYNWIRQRSRWVKGYIQTYLVHMRHPLRLYRQIGLKAFISFQFVVGGTFFGYLVNPLYWLLTAVWFLFHWGIIKDIFPTPIFYLGSIGLYLGNFAFTYLNVAGCLRRQYYDMVKYALLSPIYWAFMSVAAWKGFLQLFYKPSYWEKTEHGLYRGSIKLQTGSKPAAL